MAWLRPGARGWVRIELRTRATGPSSIVCGNAPADWLDPSEPGRPDQARGLERRRVLDVEPHPVAALDGLDRGRLLAPGERGGDHVAGRDRRNLGDQERDRAGADREQGERPQAIEEDRAG